MGQSNEEEDRSIGNIAPFAVPAPVQSGGPQQIDNTTAGSSRSSVNTDDNIGSAAPSVVNEGDEQRDLPPPVPKAGGARAFGTYRPPSWGAETPPESALSLTVLKGGVEVDSVRLQDKTRFLFGECVVGSLAAAQQVFAKL